MTYTFPSITNSTRVAAIPGAPSVASSTRSESRCTAIRKPGSASGGSRARSSRRTAPAATSCTVITVVSAPAGVTATAKSAPSAWYSGELSPAAAAAPPVAFPGPVPPAGDRRPGAPPRDRLPDRPPASPPPSLPLPAEVEAHEQDVRRPAVGERPERLAVPRLLDRALRLEIEPEAARAFDELHGADRPVAVNQEPDFRVERRTLLRPLPPDRDLRDDVVRVLGERKLDPLGRHRERVAPGGRFLPGERLRLGRGARRGFPLGVVRRGRRRRGGHGALRRLRLGCRRGLLLGRPIHRLGRFTRILGRCGRGHQMDSVRGRRRLARVGSAHQEQHPDEGVDEHRAREADADVGGRSGPALHRSTVSGSATRPTSFTPDARITASTCTTSA